MLLSAAPESLLALVRKGYRPRRGAPDEPIVELDTPTAIARAVDWLNGRTARQAISGDFGNRTTYDMAARVKDFGLSVDGIVEAMVEWNEKNEPPWDIDELYGIAENAVAYGTSAPGAKTAEAEFDAVEIEAAAVDAPKRQRLYRVEFDDAAAAATAVSNPNLIDDILDQHSFAVIYGPSNSGKTFLALSLAYHVAMGEPWDGHAVSRGAVLYVVAEGSRGINKRIAALKRHYAPAGKPPLDIIPCPIDMRSSSADVKQIVQLAVEAAAAHGLQVVLIVIDTLSRALAGGDENASTDMGAFVMNVDKLRLATSATVLVVHHTGKNIANGARGWSGLRAAIDTEIEVGDDGAITFEKQRDMEMIADIRFRLAVVSLGHGPTGKDVTSCVLQIVSAADAEFEAQMAIPPLAKDYFDTLVELGDGPTDVSTWDAAFSTFLHEGSQPTVGYRTTRRLRSTLKDAGWIEAVGKTKWRPIIVEMQEQ